MSDFRKFCFAWLATAGFLAAGDNQGWWAPIRDSSAAITMIATATGALAVIWFGKKAA